MRLGSLTSDTKDDTGGGLSVSTHDDQAIDLLTEVLRELKITNMYLSHMTDVHITEVTNEPTD